MKRVLKKFLVWTSLLIVALMIVLIVIAAFFDQQISERILSEINKQLKSELMVADVSLSLLSGFPDASIDMNEVILYDSREGTLLEAEYLSFRFGLFSLFGSDINVKTVRIDNGALFVHYNKKGQANFDILREKQEVQQKETKEKSEAISLSIREAELKDIELIFVDDRTGQEARALIKDATTSGNFSNQQFSLYCFSDIKTSFYEVDGERYFTGKTIVCDANLDVDLEKGKYTFKDFDLGIESNVFQVNGTLEVNEQYTETDLSLKGKECSLSSLLELLPEQQLSYFGDFKSKGTFVFNATVKGRYDDKQTPQIKAQFGLKNGSISGPKLPSSLKDVTFNASFTNGKKQSAAYTVFEVKDFKGYFNRELIESRLRIANLNDPKIEFDFTGTLPVESIYELLNQESISDGDGEIEIKGLSIKGRLEDMRTPSRIGKVKTAGVFEFDDAALTINSEEIVFDKGEVKIKDNSLLVESVKIEGAGSEINLNGKFLNFLPVIFADSLNTKKAELKFQASVDAPMIDIDRIIDVATNTKSAETLVAKGISKDAIKKGQNEKRERITKFLKGTFQAKVDEFNYNKIEGEDFSGKLTFDNNEMTIIGNTKGMDGRWKIDGTTYFEGEPHLEAKLICEDINIQTFFEQAENFGQEVIQSKNIEGTLHAKLAIESFWNESGKFDYDKLHIMGDLNIQNGELEGVKMLYDFSNYIKLRDLQHIKFSEMRNWLEVKKGKIYIPAMFIQTNALNMTVSGQHSFENKIDYNIKINAAQVVFSRLKKYNRNKDAQPAKKEGWFNLYYRIHGDIADYDIKSDKRTVKRRFNQSDNQKKRLQSELIKVFGSSIDLSSEPSAWNDIPEYEDEIGFDDKDDKPVLLEDLGDKLSTSKDKIPEPPQSEDDDEVEYIDWDDDDSRKKK